MATRLFHTQGGVQIDPIGNFKEIAKVDVMQFHQIRVFADNNVQTNRVLIELIEDDQSLLLGELSVRGATQVTNTYDVPGTTLRIQVAVIGGTTSTIHVVVYGIP